MIYLSYCTYYTPHHVKAKLASFTLHVPLAPFDVVMNVVTLSTFRVQYLVSERWTF